MKYFYSVVFLLLIKGISLFAFEKEYSITSKLKLNTVKLRKKL